MNMSNSESRKREAMVTDAYDALGWEAPHLADAALAAGWTSPETVRAREHTAWETCLAGVRQRIEAWVRHGEAVPADCTTYDRWIVNEELRRLNDGATSPFGDATPRIDTFRDAAEMIRAALTTTEHLVGCNRLQGCAPGCAATGQERA